MANVTIIAPAGLAYGLNETGTVVGASEGHAFIWRPTYPNAVTGIYTRLSTFDAPVSSSAAATAVNQAGDVVGFCEKVDFSGTTVTRAVMWPGDSGQPVDLGTLISDTGGHEQFIGNSRATSINDSRQVVGVSDSVLGVPHAFLYEPGVGMMDLSLDTLPSAAHGINNATEVVGWRSFADHGEIVRKACYCTATHRLLLPLPSSAGRSRGNAINNHSKIVGEADHYSLYAPEDATEAT